jgi:hypothetical protein
MDDTRANTITLSSMGNAPTCIAGPMSRTFVRAPINVPLPFHSSMRKSLPAVTSSENTTNPVAVEVALYHTPVSVGTAEPSVNSSTSLVAPALLPVLQTEFTGTSTASAKSSFSGATGAIALTAGLQHNSSAAESVPVQRTDGSGGWQAGT